MNSLGNDKALFVAEQLIDYCHEKERQENLRRYQFIQKKKEIRHTRKSVMVLSGIAGLMLVLCVTIIFLGMQVREQETRVETLKTEIAELRELNKDAEKRISNNVDYQWVREEALKLGMTPVTKDKVIYYSVENADYMVQLEEIPTK